MQIKLSDTGPALWFLGRPREVIASLSFGNPGPVEIDYESLDKSLQEKVIQDIQNGVIETTVPITELYEILIRGVAVAPVLPTVVVRELPAPSPVQAPAIPPQPESHPVTMLALQAEDEKLKERCRITLKGGAKAVKAAISHQADIKFVRRLLEEERAGKARKSIIEILEEKLGKIQQRLLDAMRPGDEEEELIIEETGLPEVVESEQQRVKFTHNDLLVMVAKSQQKGRTP